LKPAVGIFAWRADRTKAAARSHHAGSVDAAFADGSLRFILACRPLEAVVEGVRLECQGAEGGIQLDAAAGES
jgi:hypothetical protein